ncbi:MAG: ATP-binding cassette domain-containing protein [Verrucomicrobiota bacterium]|jgi:phospholipid/cholesterol/gamma-HCH transport system ATP-binding protein
MSANPNQLENVSVEVSGLRKSFGKLQVLNGINFKVNPGEIFVIMGPSGSGKSVLLRHIIGLETPDAGQILIQGEPVGANGVRDKYRMALVFQSAALLTSLSVGENVGLYLTEHFSKTPAEIATIVVAKLEAVGLAGLQDRSPGELSGGMQKRVAIARALVMEPQLFLFDEPTAELDPPMAVTIDEEILKLKNRTHATSIIVTHDRTLAFSLADRVAMIFDGQIVFVGTPEEVKRQTEPRIHEFIYAKMPTSKPS